MEKMTVIRVGNHLIRAARHVTRHESDHNEADDNQNHLEEVSQRNGPHAAVHRVKQHDQRTDHHAERHRNRTFRYQVQHEAESGDLSRHPSEVREDDENRAREFNALPIAMAVEAADREKVHLVELAGKERADKNKCHTGAERLLDHSGNSALNKTTGKTQHRFRAEPRSERSSNYHG